MTGINAEHAAHLTLDTGVVLLRRSYHHGPPMPVIELPGIDSVSLARRTMVDGKDIGEGHGKDATRGTDNIAARLVLRDHRGPNMSRSHHVSDTRSDSLIHLSIFTFPRTSRDEPRHGGKIQSEQSHSAPQKSARHSERGSSLLSRKSMVLQGLDDDYPLIGRHDLGQGSRHPVRFRLTPGRRLHA